MCIFLNLRYSTTGLGVWRFCTVSQLFLALLLLNRDLWHCWSYSPSLGVTASSASVTTLDFNYHILSNLCYSTPPMLLIFSSSWCCCLLTPLHLLLLISFGPCLLLVDYSVWLIDCLSNWIWKSHRILALTSMESLISTSVGKEDSPILFRGSCTQLQLFGCTSFLSCLAVALPLFDLPPCLPPHKINGPWAWKDW